VAVNGPIASANTAPALQRPSLSLHQLLIQFPGGLAESSNFLAFTHLWRASAPSYPSVSYPSVQGSRERHQSGLNGAGETSA